MGRWIELRHNIISPTPTFYSRKLIHVQGDLYDGLTQADYNAQTQMKSGSNLNESLVPTIREVEYEIKQEEKSIECDAERDANF